MQDPEVFVRLVLTLGSHHLPEIARHVRAQAPPAEWEVIRDFALQVVALAEAVDQGYSVAVVPASALTETGQVAPIRGKD